jgi:radical SAM superfamily enzyme YgiQ (UPF0313 family)
MTKVLLIQPPDPPKTQCLRDHMGMFGILKKGISLIKNDILPPLNLAYSASLLEKNDFEVNLIDAPALEYDIDKTLQEVEKIQPNLVVINSAGVTDFHDMLFARQIKSKTDSIVSVTGPHITLNPENALKYRGIDVVIRGDIEYTVLELSEKLSNFKDIKGIAFKKGKKIITTPRRPLIMGLDKLSFPAFHLLPMKKYRYNLFEKTPFTTILTSRGCPFGCIYCPYPLGYGEVWRGRSVENVLEELIWLKNEYKIKSLLFRDQVATFDMKRSEKIYDGMIKEGLDFEWRCETRVDRVNKRLFRKMKQSGCAAVHFGVESGDPIILKNIGKAGNITVKMIKKVFKDAKEVGLSTVGYFLIGLPGETEETIEKTIQLAKELNADESWFNSPVPYPGTRLHDIAEKNSWILTNDLERYSGTEVVMRNEKLTKKDIEESLKHAKTMFPGKSTHLLKLLFTRRGFVSTITNPKMVLKYAVGRFKDG